MVAGGNVFCVCAPSWGHGSLSPGYSSVTLSRFKSLSALDEPTRTSNCPGRIWTLLVVLSHHSKSFLLRLTVTVCVSPAFSCRVRA